MHAKVPIRRSIRWQFGRSACIRAAIEPRRLLRWFDANRIDMMPARLANQLTLSADSQRVRHSARVVFTGLPVGTWLGWRNG